MTRFHRLFQVVILLFCVTILLSSSTMAFDGQRKGFILGFGVGPGLTPNQGDNKIHLINTDFKIGAGLSEQFQLYWSTRVSWYKVDVGVTGSITEIFGMGGAGISYFFSPYCPCAYVTAGFGFSALSYPFETDDPIDPEMGLGLSMGLGYEWSRHLSVEGNLVCGSIHHESKYYGTYNEPRWSFKVTINALAY